MRRHCAKGYQGALGPSTVNGGVHKLIRTHNVHEAGWSRPGKYYIVNHYRPNTHSVCMCVTHSLYMHLVSLVCALYRVSSSHAWRSHDLWCLGNALPFPWLLGVSVCIYYWYFAIFRKCLQNDIIVIDQFWFDMLVFALRVISNHSFVYGVRYLNIACFTKHHHWIGTWSISHDWWMDLCNFSVVGVVYYVCFNEKPR